MPEPLIPFLGYTAMLLHWFPSIVSIAGAIAFGLIGFALFAWLDHLGVLA